MNVPDALMHAGDVLFFTFACQTLVGATSLVNGENGLIHSDVYLKTGILTIVSSISMYLLSSFNVWLLLIL